MILSWVISFRKQRKKSMKTNRDYLEKAVTLCDPDVCAVWPFSRDTTGAGQFGVEGKMHLAHRYAWRLINGAIPEGLRVYHSCCNRACFNPYHLFLGTTLDHPKVTQSDYLEKALPLCTPDTCAVWPFGIEVGGYGRVGAKGRIYKTHRYVWELVNGPIPPGLFVCHKCDNKPCFNPHHLFLGTHIDNMRDMAEKGRGSYGERHCRARLTEAQVREIRRKHAKDVLAGKTWKQIICTYRDLAHEYSVTEGTIRFLLAGKTWKQCISDS